MPCVMQDARSGEVLTLAYMNEESLQLTLETREIHLYSRSRREIWHKGATSGNVQRRSPDPLRLRRRRARRTGRPGRARPVTPASAPASIATWRGPPIPASTRPASSASRPRCPTRRWPALERTLVARQRRRPEGSYTVELLEDPRLAGDKVREEAAEVVKAVNSESEERVAEEGADVVYHLAVLLLSAASRWRRSFTS